MTTSCSDIHELLLRTETRCRSSARILSPRKEGRSAWWWFLALLQSLVHFHDMRPCCAEAQNSKNRAGLDENHVHSSSQLSASAELYDTCRYLSIR